MKIAQISPLAERCPPRMYGGTERVVSFLTEELVRQGHDVTLFASGDSITTAELVPCCSRALRLDPNISDHLPYHVMMLAEVLRRADEFDVLHFHIDLHPAPMVRELALPSLTTLHGRLDLPDLQPFYMAFPDLPLVSISNAQRAPMPPVNWMGTVYHGLPRDLLPFSPTSKGRYLAFLGRISPEKRPDRAIEIARRAGMELKIAAKIDKVDQAYWDDVIEPLVRQNPHVEFVGEISDSGKAQFLGDAAGLLFPIDWPEPFGLVMIEAMACGTPVLAFACGSTREIIDTGQSGFLVTTVDEAVDAVDQLLSLDRAGVRAAFEARFTVETMAACYVDLYARLPNHKPTGALSGRRGRSVADLAA